MADISGIYYIDSLLRDEQARWNRDEAIGTPVTVTFSFPTSVPGDYAPGDMEQRNFLPFDSTIQPIARAVIAKMAEIVNVTFEEVSGSDARIRFGTYDFNGSFSFGRAYFPFNEQKGGDIWLNNFGDEEWTTNPSINYDTLLHELGHAMGLKHPYDFSPNLPHGEDNGKYTVVTDTSHPTMSSAPSGYMLYDIAALQYLYGANMSTRAGNTVYSWAPNLIFHETIWDAGGNDTIDASNRPERAIIDLTAGHFSSIGRTLADFTTDEGPAVDNVGIAFGVTIENAIGGPGNDQLIGNSFANQLTGGAGNDTLTGKGGADTLTGGAGNDTAVYAGDRADFTIQVNAGEQSLQIVGLGSNHRVDRDVETLRFDDQNVSTRSFFGDEYLWSALSNGQVITPFVVGSDVLRFDSATISAADVTVTLGSVILTHESMTVTLDANMAAVATGDIAFQNGSLLIIGDNTVGTAADSLANTLDGGTGNDHLIGLGGNDTLNGGSGSDRLAGGGGDDSLNGGAGGDNMTGGSGNDTYVFSGSNDVAVETAGGGIDSVRAASGATLQANLENLFLVGTDFSPVDGTGNTLDNAITGNHADNILTGNAGNDTLDGGTGSDTLIGGAGNDLYRSTDFDVVTEEAGGGTDTLETTSDVFALDAGLENLTLLGTAGYGLGNESANVIVGNATANTLSGFGENDVLMGGGAGDELFGHSGNDTLDGGTGADALDGEDGDDRLIGGSGVDTLTGGFGNDIYDIDSSDVLGAEFQGGGIDLINTAVSHTLAENFDNLTLLDTANRNGTGNALDNVLTGNRGDNRLEGLDGNDTLIGGNGLDELEGGAGNDSLDGGASADDLTGGLGDDVYAVSTSDDVFENAGGGFDIVRAISSYVLSENIEVLVLLGTGNTRGLGNAGDNEIDGNSGNNKLVGNVGDDVLDGGTGADRLLGGGGNDVLVWDAADLEVRAGSAKGDIVRLEGAGQALDLTTISNSRIEDVEILDITGSGDNTLTLALADVLAISGNTDTLRIDGNAGDDVEMISGGWTQGADDVIGSNTYHQYTRGTAVLLVDTDVSIDFP